MEIPTEDPNVRSNLIGAVLGDISTIPTLVRLSPPVAITVPARLEVVEDLDAGAEAYIKERSEWDRYVTVLARHLDHRLEDIDPPSWRTEEDTV